VPPSDACASTVRDQQRAAVRDLEARLMRRIAAHEALQPD
jgi:hypothetical protein